MAVKVVGNEDTYVDRRSKKQFRQFKEQRAAGCSLWYEPEKGSVVYKMCSLYLYFYIFSNLMKNSKSWTHWAKLIVMVSFHLKRIRRWTGIIAKVIPGCFINVIIMQQHLRIDDICIHIIQRPRPEQHLAQYEM